MRWSGLCLVASLATTSAAAETRHLDRPEPPPSVRDGSKETRCRHGLADPDACVTPLRRTGAIVASIATGFVLRGVGSYLVGEKRAAKRLAVVGGLGLGAFVIGGAPVGISGGLPATMPLVPVLLAGSGALFTSWWADIGVAAGVSTIGQARAAAPWSVELATLYLSDPYRQAGLGRLGGELALGRVTLGGSLLADAEGELWTGVLDVQTRLAGAAATGEVVDDGSRLIVRTGLSRHHDGGDRTTIATAELELIGRLELRHLERALRGTFVQASTGVGVDRTSYTGARDHHSVLLGTFGWGVYLGNRGEVAVFYDHRRESMVGGLAAGRAAGFVGSMNAALDWMLDRRWATHLEVNVGNAWLTTFAVRYRGGGR